MTTSVGRRSEDPQQVLTRDRPWLLPTNRKLRHLEGISIRNVCVSKSAARSNEKTVDDEYLPYAFKSPSRLLALDEHPTLGHSRSSSNLESQAQESEKLAGQANGKHAEGRKPRLPRPNLRRRSTLNWSNATPQVRQTRLEDLTNVRLAETWFSIHDADADADEPLYISEVVGRAMNPNFRFFDLKGYGPNITRRDELRCKVWARTEDRPGSVLLVDLRVHLASLQFIGRSLENFHHPLPENCVVFHLADGIYTSFTHLSLDPNASLLSRSSSQTPESKLQPTSSFDALMRLSNLDDCIQDALATREALTKQIESLLDDTCVSRETVAAVPGQKESLGSAQRALSNARRSLNVTKTKKSELEASINERKKYMQEIRQSQDSILSNLPPEQHSYQANLRKSEEASLSLMGQTRRICEDISEIYPIEPIPGKPLSFEIRDLHLPNANLVASSTDASETTVAAALGMVAHILHLLSHYLSCPLPYPVTPHGSSSSIYDPISTSLNARAGNVTANRNGVNPTRSFPLYGTSTVQYRFEYGVFLLNTDLELLMWKRGLRMVDQRQTLANLKYLLVVLGSGKGDIPGRKKGIVGGLISGNASPLLKPTSSANGEYARVNNRDENDDDGATMSLKRSFGNSKGQKKIGSGRQLINASTSPLRS
ncbi:hypothetical protein MMC25_007309 [Agyrium rufum]|nr:hypothetical protein [Agyrium rufum]